MTWTPTDDPFLADTAYTAVVTLTPASGYAFTAPMTLNTASVDPVPAASLNDDGTLIWTIPYPKTQAKALTGLEVTTPPDKMTYVTGDSLDKTGLVVTALYDDGSSQVLPNSQITVTYPNGDSLVSGDTAVTLASQGQTVLLEGLTVAAKPVALPAPAQGLTYTGTEQTGVSASADYTVTDGSATNAGDYTATLALTDPAHTVWADTSDTADQTLAWSIAKATPTGAPAFDKVTAAGKALADVPLTIGSIQPADGSLAWDDPAQTTLERDKAYAWTFTPADTVNYTTLTGTAVPYTARSSSGGGGGGGGGGVSLHMVEVLPAQGGTVTVDKTPASRGATIHLTVTPDQGASLTSLTAKDASGKILSLTWDGNVASFSMPASKVTVTPVFSGGAAAGPFDDVQASDWFNDPVLWVNDRGLMTGTAARTFSPSMTTTRGMIVSVLNRLEGSPAPQSACSFLDVASGSWYENAIAWGAENGVVDGYSDTLFGPDDPITREQMAAMLHKYALYKGYDVPHPMT